MPAGGLTGVPFIRDLKGKGGMPADFAMSDHGLRRLRIASYNGVIFVSFDHEIESLEAFLDQPMLDYFDAVFGRPIEILGYLRQRIPANWKLYYENLVDDYHGGLLHPFQVTFGIARMTQGGGSITDVDAIAGSTSNTAPIQTQRRPRGTPAPPSMTIPSNSAIPRSQISAMKMAISAVRI